MTSTRNIEIITKYLTNQYTNEDAAEIRNLVQKIPDRMVKIISEQCEKINKLNLIKEKIEETMRCPITMERMYNPWSITVCNHTFEGNALQRFILFGNNKCPLCRKDFNPGQLVPNKLLNDIALSYDNMMQCIDNNGIKKPMICELEIKKPRRYMKYQILYLNGNKYTGTLKAGTKSLSSLQPHGHGTMWYENGDIYRGIWKNGSRNSHGTIEYKNGGSETGLWENDRFVRKCESEPNESKENDENKVESLTVNMMGSFFNTMKCPSNKDHPGKDQSGKDPSAKDQSGKDPSGKDQSGKDPENKDPVNKDPVDKYPQNNNPENNEPLNNDPETKNPEIKNPKIKNPETKDPGPMKNPWTISVCSHTFEKSSITTNYCNTCNATFKSDHIIANNIIRDLITNCLDLKSYYNDSNCNHKILLIRSQTQLAIYEGEVRNGLRHGCGTIIQDNGTTYTGNWENDAPSGYGKVKYTDGYTCKSKGFWKDLKLSGFGICMYSDGARYIGYWVNDVRSGYGIYRYHNGSKYEGNSVNDIKSGYGIYTYHNGSKYEGNWVNDIKSGYGIYTYHNGSKYEGNWVNNIRSGYGIFTWADGDKYEGIWKNDERCGKGTLIKTNGRKYGQYLRGNFGVITSISPIFFKNKGNRIDKNDVDMHLFAR